MTFKESIDKIISIRLETYSREHVIFKAIYTEEKRLIEDYNGRQLLEMLQNADDAGASRVLIEWDTNATTLKISNSGKAFSVAGIESLMLPNTSTKTGKVFIGNKGLGFRSILNWADNVTIYSNGCKIDFSEAIATCIFNEELGLTELQKKQMRQECNLNSDGIPFPVLGIPCVTEVGNQQWASTIAVRYKSYYETKIDEQIHEIKEEILLFLNNIETIDIIIDRTPFKSIHCKKEKHDPIDKGFTVVTIGEKEWNVFESGEVMLPDEYQKKNAEVKELYSLKIAVSKDLKDNYRRLFNFFPTKVSIDLPCIIHGTFDLSSNRDHLNQSEKNDYIISQLPALFIRCIEKLKADGLSWNAFRLLLPGNDKTDSQEVHILYAALQKLRNNDLAICPTIGGKYLKLEEVKYYGQLFNEFALKHFIGIMPEIALPLPEGIEIPDFDDKHYKPELFTKLLNTIPDDCLTIQQRAELIVMLSSVNGIMKSSLLINKEGTIIPSDETSFTPRKQSDLEYATPKYARIHFMNIELYDHLVQLLRSELDTGERDRELKRRIDDVVNIQPYDSTAILERISTRTKHEIERVENDHAKILIIKEMVANLFLNFTNQDAERRKAERVTVDIPLVNNQEKIINSEELLLNKTYKSGLTTESIYEDTFQEYYLADRDFWELDKFDAGSIEDFFLWLGVNRYSRLALLRMDHNFGEWDFFQTASKYGELEIPTDYNASQLFGNEFYKIRDFEKVSSLDPTRILLLCLADDFIREELNRKNIEVKWSYARLKKSTYSNMSYIRYQFIRSGIFSGIIIDDSVREINAFLNKDALVDFEFLLRLGYEENEIKALLLRLGAHSSINSLPANSLYAILKTIALQDDQNKVRGIQSIYKLIADTLESQESKMEVPADLKLFAKQNGNNILLPAGDIYYSNNNVLPAKIMDSLPILNFPKRSGENKLEKYFGINIIESSNIKLGPQITHDRYYNEFTELFEQLKPLILTYRLYSKNLKKEITSRDAINANISLIKNCVIVLVDECSYQYESFGFHRLDHNDFVLEKNTFYLRPPQETDFRHLIKNSDFCDAFAEIISILFNVSELKNDFRILLRNDVSDSKHLIKKDFDDEKVNKIQEYMGIPASERKFWESLFALKGKIFSDDILNMEQLKRAVQSSLHFTLPVYYGRVNFEVCRNRETYDFIYAISESLQVTMKDYYPMGVKPWHEENLLNCREDHEIAFKSVLWDKLCKAKEQQWAFLGKIDKFKLSPIKEMLTENHNYSLTLDYKNILRDWTMANISIDLKSDHTGNYNPVLQYPKLLQKYGIDLTDINETKIKSLLYFIDNDTQIEEYLKFKRQLHQEQLSMNEDDEDDNDFPLEIVAASLQKDLALPFVSPNDEKSNKAKKRLTYSGKDDDRKRIKGKKAEKRVFNEFVKIYGKDNVQWLSSFSENTDSNDNLQYDIKYRSEKGIWKHVEVKALSGNNSFILTNAEKEHGISEKGKYELALINDKKIYRIFDPFEFSNEDTFESNKSFTASPKDFILNFKILEK